MMFGMMLATLVASAPAAQPAAHAPDRLRIIVTVKSSTFCSAMRSMALPIGFVTRVNLDALSSIIDDARQGMALSGAAGGAAYYDALQTKEAPGAPVQTWSPLTAGIHAQATAQDVRNNLMIADDLMNASWQRYPRGTNVDVDGFRQRLQNLIDLQRATLNDLEGASAYYFHGLGSPPHPPSTLREAREADADAALLERTTSDPEDLPERSAHDVAHFGSPLQVREQLDLQESAFAKEITVAGQTCGI